LGDALVCKRLSIHQSTKAAVELLQDFKPTAIYSFPSWLEETSLTASALKRQLPKVPIIFTSSEVLTPAIRSRIETAFSAEVCDIYGNTEFKEVAWQCAEGRYHINFESTWVEDTRDDDGSDESFLVLTSLNNRAMPLIRYSVGDRGRFNTGSCACGRHSPYLENLGGRQTDVVVLADGRRLSPYLLSTSIESHPGIARYQLVQPSPGRLLVNYVPRENYTQSRLQAELASRLNDSLGSNLDIQFRETLSISRDPSGKSRILIRSAGDK
jgi:phenylacetate-CoA ligase